MMKIISIQEELTNRLQSVRTMIDKDGLDALLIYSHLGYSANVRYLSNYLPTLGDVYMIIWPNRGPMLVTAFDYDVARAKSISGIEDVSTSQGGKITIKDLLTKGGFKNGGRLGVVGFNIFPVSFYKMIQQAFPAVKMLDIATDFERLRLIKSSYEVEMLRIAGDITDAGFRAIKNAIKEGVTELDLAAEADAAIRRAGAEKWAAGPIIMSGPEISEPIRECSDRKLKYGDLIMVDIGAVYKGYSADVARVFAVGKINTEQQKMFDTVLEAYHRSVELIKDNRPMKAIHKVADDIIAKAGYAGMVHRIGHGVGLETSLEKPDLMREDGNLETGMSICIEPGIYIFGQGAVKLEDYMVVTKDGCEILAHFPLELQCV